MQKTAELQVGNQLRTMTLSRRLPYMNDELRLLRRVDRLAKSDPW